MKKIILLNLMILLVSCFVAATNKTANISSKVNNDTLTHLPLYASLKVEGAQVNSDPVENYYISSSTSIWKTSSQNNQKFIFDSKKSGNISLIDAGDPMKVLVFYKDLSLITFLDNFMAETSFNISLMDFGLDQAEVVCKALNNGIWVYDVKQDKLVKISSALKVEVEILNIQRIIGEAFSPAQMMERTSGLYLNDPNKGIFVFDNYGSFLRKIPELNILKFNVIEDVIAFRQDNDINTLNTKTLEFNKIYSNSLMTDFSINEKKLYILNADSLHIYKLNP
ncbi:MAG: hypothetical protein ACO3E1_03760 [Flavobacteriales bacterium]